MIKALKEFKKYGHEYLQLQRHLDVALYELSLDSNVIGFEIHIIKKLKPTNILDREYSERETLASTEQFGLKAWSFQKFDDALAKYNELLHGQLQGLGLE